MRVRADLNELVGGGWAPDERGSFTGDVSELGAWVEKQLRALVPAADRGDEGEGTYAPAFEVNITIEEGEDTA